MIGIEAEDALEDGAPRVRLPISRGALVAFPAGSVPAATGWRKIPILPSLMARRAAKYFSTSIFLIRAIAAPAAPLHILCGLFQAAEDSGLKLAQATSRWVDWASNGFARYDQLHSPVLLPSSGVIVRGYRRTIAEACCADRGCDYALLHKVIADSPCAIL
jgi:hypothetical protein